MMSNYIIQGGKKLKGEVLVGASKNSAVAILIGALLNEGRTVIKNLPKIEEVFRIIEVLESLGAETSWRSGHEFEIKPPKKVNLKNINKEAAAKTRSLVMFIGVLLHKLTSFELPQSGGCQLGRRTIMPHIYALQNFGVEVKISGNKVEIERRKLHPASSDKAAVMYESGDTATANALFAASLIPGKSVIKFASANYQVQDLCFFLEQLGVRIEGTGTTTLTIYGRKRIKKDIEYYLTEDPIEAMLFIAAAVMTGSSIVIKRCPIDFLELELLKLEKMGFRYDILRHYKARNKKARLTDIKTYPSKLKAPVEKLYGRPYPGLNIDNLPFFVPIATQAKGQTLIHDWSYENRAIYYVELNRLAANITLADPYRVFVEGPTKLRAAEIVCPPALRPSSIIMVAMLGAKGESILRNVYSIERGHEKLEERLRRLGADIRRIKN